jgi:hypothetical protein
MTDKMLLNLSMCVSPWKPLGICISRPCDTSASTQMYDKTKKSYVRLPLQKEGLPANNTLITVFMRGPEFQEDCLIGNCGQASDVLRWSKSGTLVSVPAVGEPLYKLENMGVDVIVPIPYNCGVEFVKILWDDGAVTVLNMDIAGEMFDNYMKMSVGETYIYNINGDDNSGKLVPGVQIAMSIVLRDGMSEHVFDAVDFETELLTSGIIAGCGLWDEDTASWLDGGDGEAFKDYYASEHDYLRWVVRVNDEYFKLRSADVSAYALDSRVFIAKGILTSATVEPVYRGSEADLFAYNSDAVPSEISESSDCIIPVTLYGALVGGVLDV